MIVDGLCDLLIGFFRTPPLAAHEIAAGVRVSAATLSTSQAAAPVGIKTDPFAIVIAEHHRFKQAADFFVGQGGRGDEAFAVRAGNRLRAIQIDDVDASSLMVRKADRLCSTYRSFSVAWMRIPALPDRR